MAKKSNFERYQENKSEVETYLARLELALKDPETKVRVQEERTSDKGRPYTHTNIGTLTEIFGSDGSEKKNNEILRRELAKLNYKDYRVTLKDKDLPKRSDLREFGKILEGKEIYIKFRVELITPVGKIVFALSFHESDRPFKEEDFPLRNE